MNLNLLQTGDPQSKVAIAVYILPSKRIVTASSEALDVFNISIEPRTL
jgi:hypothetical protein